MSHVIVEFHAIALSSPLLLNFYSVTVFVAYFIVFYFVFPFYFRIFVFVHVFLREQCR